MSYNINRKKIEAARINRTPAPDSITNIRNPKGAGAGANGPQPSFAPVGVSIESSLATNLRQSSDDGENVIGKLISGGLRGNRSDALPDINDETREVKAEMYKPSWGAKQQQDPDFWKSKADLPSSTEQGGDDSDQRRQAGLRRTDR